MKSWTRVPALWLLAGLLTFTAPLAAVQLSPSGEGGALIFPVWATTNGHLSVLSVVDAQFQSRSEELPSQAVKLLLRDAQGQLLFSANIYTRRSEDTWSASITSLPDGRSRLASSDDTCVLVGESGAVAPWSGSVDLDADHGFIEVIAMATFATQGGDGSCPALAARWNGGIWSQDPTVDFAATNINAGLRGTLNLVNVQKGTAYTIPATALREFSDISQHTAPSSGVPDLASAHDSGTAQNATRSRVCDATHCLDDTWTSPRDAVAVALMASTVRGEYSNSPSLAGKSDLVFAYPLRHHFGAEDDGQLSAPRPTVYTFSRGGEYVGGSPAICPGQPPQGCEPSWSLYHPVTLAFLSFPGTHTHDFGQPSAVLGIDVQGNGMYVTPPAPEGSFRAEFGGRLLSNSGRNYLGTPVIGLVLQQFENGNLIGNDGVQQRANYGVALPMTRTVP